MCFVALFSGVRRYRSARLLELPCTFIWGETITETINMMLTMGGSPFRFLGDSLAVKFLALLPTLPTLVSQFTKSPMAFYIDTTSNHLHQTQRSIRKVPPHLSHISSFEGLLDRYPVPTSPRHLPSSFLDIHQYYRKDGSNKETRVALIKQPYTRPSFKKLFPEIRTTKNFRSIKRRILPERQSNFFGKAIRNLSSYQLSPNEIGALALGLNFVLTPSRSTHHLIQKSDTRLTQSMKKQLHFKNHPLTIKRPTCYKPSTWIPPEQNSTNSITFPGTDSRPSP